MIKATERRERILTILHQQKEPISATAIARECSVSRQIIVGDIALLRASGMEIAATPRGYVLSQEGGAGMVRHIACRHEDDKTALELKICVDQGCTVQDVIVEHPVYGQLTGELHITSRYDVEQFLQRLEEEHAHSLCELTDGVHLHTLICPSEAAYERVCRALQENQILFVEE